MPTVQRALPSIGFTALPYSFPLLEADAFGPCYTFPGNAISQHKMPWGGDMIGISIAVSDPAAAGSVVLQATVNGVAVGPLLTMTITDQLSKRLEIGRGQVAFAANDEIGIYLSCSATYEPDGSDPAASLLAWVAFDVGEV